MFEKKKKIGTTGPEMRRFFFTVDDAVKLVHSAMNKIDIVQGKVLSRKMKSCVIKDLLNIWIEIKGGEWEVIEGRPGERNDEFLIGDQELPYTKSLFIDDIEHYLISFNEKAINPIKLGLSSENAERLTKDEIIDIIEYGNESK